MYQNSMEELRQMGLTYYTAATEEIKQMVDAIYKEMDPKGNGHVEFKEFSAYMETNDCQYLSSDEFFDLLKRPGHEGLFIDDVMTLFYIIYSKRPFCGGKCRKFVTGMYFTCVQCFDGSGSTFSVCPHCFVGEQYKHEHKEFLDPMVILHLKRKLDINQKSSTSRDDEDEEEPIDSSTTTTTTTSTSTSKMPKYERSTSSDATVVMNALPASPASSSSSSNDKPDTSSSISNSIVPAVNQQSKQAKIQTAIQFGQLVASIGSIVFASQLCTIM